MVFIWYLYTITPYKYGITPYKYGLFKVEEIFVVKNIKKFYSL